ncbi:methyl-accepting chemotaxis protein [Leeia sp.]|uniref:methyl-accepting chemotaxis protein n=1 Tax=Leeia sp. TaxID=2884678 RepID=UPI0035B34C2A
MAGRTIKLRKLLVGFNLAIIGMLVLLVITAAVRLVQNANQVQSDLQQTQVLPAAIHDARFHVVQIQQFLTDVSATGDGDGFTDAEEHYQALQQSLQQAARLAPELTDEASQVTALSNAFYGVGKEMAKRYQQQGREAGNALMKQPQTGFDDRAEALTNKLDQLTRHAQQLTTAAVQLSTAQAVQLRNLIVGLGVLVLGLVVVAGLVLYRRLFEALGGEPALAVSVTRAVAAGDLSQSIMAPASSLLGELGGMQQQLRNLSGQIRTLSGQLTEDAQQLTHTAQRMESGVTQQGDATRSIAAALEEMFQSMTQLGERAEEVSREAHSVDQSISQGETVIAEAADGIRLISSQISEAAQAIHQLDGQTEAIAQITNTIHGIADQTNLLALNAAIEAARAGESGRGFAVVADEVRKLAERTGGATVEIGQQITRIRQGMEQVVQLMQASVAASGQGVVQTTTATEAIGQIRQNAGQINQSIQSIADALAEQQRAMQDIASKVEVIASMTEGNEQSTHQVTQAANGVRDRAEYVSAAIAVFRH